MFSLFKPHRQLAVSLVLIFSAVAPRSRTPTVVPPGGEDRTTLEIAGRVSWTLSEPRWHFGTRLAVPAR